MCKIFTTVNGGWSTWIPGKCSVTCGIGIVQLTRRCDNPRPANGGRNCFGNSQIIRQCNKGCCPGTSQVDNMYHVAGVFCNGKVWQIVHDSPNLKPAKF